MNNVTLRLDLAMNGQQSVQNALQAMRQQFQQASTSLTTFRNLLNAAPGTHLAQRQLELNALRAEVRAAEAGAGARAMATLGGQKSLQRIVRAEADTGLGAAQQMSAVGRARADYAESGSGRQTAAATAAAAAETRLAEARQRNAALAAEVGHAESTTGRDDLRRLALLDQQQGTLGLRRNVAAAQAGADVAASPAGQQALQQQAALQGQGSLATMRRELAEMRARDAHEQSPRGRRERAERRGLEQEQQEREESRGRRDTISQFGELGGRMRLFGETLKKAAVAAGPVIGFAVAGAAVAMKAQNEMLRLAAVANPAGASTLEKSRVLAEASIGDIAGAMQNRRAADLQALAARAQEMSPEQRGALSRLVDTFGNPMTYLRLLPSNNTFGQGVLAASNDMNNPPKPPKRDFPSPFQSRIQSFEEYDRSLQLAATNTSDLDADILRVQLQNFLGSGGQLLERLVQNTENLRNLNPAWRG